MSDFLHDGQLPNGLEAAFQEMLSTSNSTSQSVITGLEKRSELNGMVCTKDKFDENTGRWTCAFIDAKGDEKKIAIKPANLREK